MAVLLTPESEFAATKPHVVEKIRQDFTIAPWQVDQVLPAFGSRDNCHGGCTRRVNWASIRHREFVSRQ